MAKRSVRSVSTKDLPILSRCPFCGGKVYMSLVGGGEYQECWLQINGGAGVDDCHCRVFMESGYFEETGGEDERRERTILVMKWNRRTKQ